MPLPKFIDMKHDHKTLKIRINLPDGSSRTLVGPLSQFYVAITTDPDVYTYDLKFGVGFVDGVWEDGIDA